MPMELEKKEGNEVSVGERVGRWLETGAGQVGEGLSIRATLDESVKDRNQRALLESLNEPT